ncbi:MAG: alpha/beta hydrolase [Saprospiraceae bacterium]|nr:alpha/beta hydrolase [Saprospiraceae bacterium]MCF8249992.1 alpha/beta hydrolase [Saprospiraceae bacterium]MCF8278968.1 hypothetical protein [Bacteroidales bacterium]MCF8311005.1 alpha/beta hydrolase [Saprospiraceae bacterium]MCF8439659.1 alpha/beta hydrolase [Saprospiraceae bacterium]
MKQIKLIAVLFILASISAYSQASKVPVSLSKTPFIIGEAVEFHSNELNENRTLNIYIPVSYHPDSLRNFPVIYLLDGTASEDFIHTVGIVQFGNYPWINMLPESIVVGIANVDRKRDFTFPTTVEQDKKDFPTTGGSAKFIQFLESELKPFVEANYLTNDTTTLIGQSLGGLLATEILFKKPELFTNYIIVSPSMWWDKESLWKYMPQFKPANKSIYIGVGKKEHKLMVKAAKTLNKKVNAQHIPGFRMHHKLFKTSGHADILHLALYDAFDWMFGTKTQ